MLLGLFEALNLAGSLGSIISFPPVLVAVAIYLAVTRGDKAMSDRARRWIIVLLAIGAFGYALDVTDRLGYIRNLNWSSYYIPNRIVGQKYYNQEVILDGNEYIDCEFHNVTFVYNGTTPARVSGGQLFPPIVYRSNNLAVTSTLLMAVGTGSMRNVKLIGPPIAVHEPPIVATPQQ